MGDRSFYSLGAAIRRRDIKTLALLFTGLVIQLLGIALVFGGLFAILFLADRFGEWSQSWNWEAFGRVAGGFVGVIAIFGGGLLLLSLVVLAIAIPISYAMSLFRRR